ncbi:hypothetical protein HK096_003988, partial [Nowakowskiella sp. JEL0078]
MKLFCKFNAYTFPVDVDFNHTVGDLKKNIKGEGCPEFDSIAACQLTIVRVYTTENQSSGVADDEDLTTMLQSLESA